MKTVAGILLLIIAGTISCERDDTSDRSYIAYLRDKAVITIIIREDTKYFLTARHCDTCYVAPHMSYIPSIFELTVANDSGYNNYFSDLNTASLNSDKDGNVYLMRGNKLYHISENGDTEVVLNTGEYQFIDFAPDPDGNLWFWNYNDAAFWDKTSLSLFTPLYSYLQEDLIMGLTVDNSGTIWICTDHNLIKTDGLNLTLFPYSEIPGSTQYSRMRNPIAYPDGSMWFEFNSDTSSGILRFKDNNWSYSFPDTTTFCDLKLDDEGTLWAVSNHYTFDSYGDLKLPFATLKYYDNGSWIDVDISDVKTKILTVNADEEKIYLGTVNGLIEKLK